VLWSNRFVADCPAERKPGQRGHPPCPLAHNRPNGPGPPSLKRSTGSCRSSCNRIDSFHRTVDVLFGPSPIAEPRRWEALSIPGELCFPQRHCRQSNGGHRRAKCDVSLVRSIRQQANENQDRSGCAIRSGLSAPRPAKGIAVDSLLRVLSSGSEKEPRADQDAHGNHGVHRTASPRSGMPSAHLSALREHHATGGAHFPAPDVPRPAGN